MPEINPQPEEKIKNSQTAEMDEAKLNETGTWKRKYNETGGVWEKEPEFKTIQEKNCNLSSQEVTIK